MEERFSPFPYLRKLWRHAGAGLFIVISTVSLLLAVKLWEYCEPVPCFKGVSLRAVLIGLVLWRFVDIFVTNVSITFTTRFPANPIRSVVYSVASYVQIAIAFAFFYAVLGEGHFRPVGDPNLVPGVGFVSVLFYSFTTIATIGYGGLEPTTTMARFVVISELVSGLFFVAIILATVTGWSRDSRKEEGEYRLGQLQAPDRRTRKRS